MGLPLIYYSVELNDKIFQYSNNTLFWFTLVIHLQKVQPSYILIDFNNNPVCSGRLCSAQLCYCLSYHVWRFKIRF